MECTCWHAIESQLQQQLANTEIGWPLWFHLSGKISPITNFLLLRKHPPPGNPPLGSQEEKRSFSLDWGWDIHESPTLTFLLLPPPQSPATCPHCQRHCLSVDHFFACPLLLSLRYSLTFPLPLSKPSEITPMQFLVPFNTTEKLERILTVIGQEHLSKIITDPVD